MHVFEIIDKELNRLNDDLAVSSKVRNMVEVDCEPEIMYNHLALEFRLSQGKVKCLTSGIDGKGNPYEFPNYSQLKKEGINYLISTLDKAQNNYVKVRYNQIIFNSEWIKNLTYLNNAIEAQKLIINDLVTIDTQGSQYLANFLNLAGLMSSNRKYYSDLRTIVKQQLDICTLDWIEYRIIKHSLELKNIFTQKDIEYFKPIQEARYLELESKNEWRTLIDVCNLSIRLCERLQISSTVWLNRLGNVYHQLLDNCKEQDPTGMLALEYCGKAIRNYKKAKNIDKTKILRIKREQLKDKLNLSTISVELDISKDFIESRLEARHKLHDKLFKMDSVKMFHTLGFGAGMFPNFESLKGITTENTTLLRIMNSVHYDQNNNVRGRTNSTDENDQNIAKQTYKFYLEFFTIPEIYEVLREGVLTEKITFNTLCDFLIENSWFGKSPIEEEWKWIHHIFPALMEFYNSFSTSLIYKDSHMGYTLALDSLVMKFEGAFRELAKGLGCIVTTEDDRKGGERLLYIHELLYADDVIEKFNEQDLFFYKFLYLEDGYNLRNNIAHSSMHPFGYTLDKMLLVFMSFLRLGNFDLKIVSIKKQK